MNRNESLLGGRVRLSDCSNMQMRERKESRMAFRILIWATRRMITSITKRCTQSRLLGGNEELSFGLIKCMVSTGRCPEVSESMGL